jgi:hypothetical protein
MWTSALPVVEEAGASIKITSNKRDKPLALQWNRKRSSGGLFNGAVLSPYRIRIKLLKKAGRPAKKATDME